MCIMAVDAEPSALDDLREKLCSAFPQQTVVAFGNPLDALKYAEEHPIDLLFTDVRLRPFDGYELIRTLRQKQAFYAYVVSGSREHPDDLSWMNVNGCYTKPVQSAELRELACRLSAPKTT